jgi:myo-inositol-1(or 4)-monophosphatase
MPASPLLTVMTNAARKASRAIRRDFGEVESLQVSQKGPANFVTSGPSRRSARSFSRRGRNGAS